MFSSSACIIASSLQLSLWILREESHVQGKSVPKREQSFGKRETLQALSVFGSKVPFVQKQTNLGSEVASEHAVKVRQSTSN